MEMMRTHWQARFSSVTCARPKVYLLLPSSSPDRLAIDCSMVNKHGKPTAFAAHQHVLPRANPKTHSRNGFFASCTRGNGAGYASDSLGAVQGLSFPGIGRPDRFSDARALPLAWSVRASKHSTLVSVCDEKYDRPG